jgi:hypothetical protein
MRSVNAESLPAAMAAVAVLALSVNFVELLRTAGLPAIYTAILTQQNLRGFACHTYLGLYVAGYIADDALMVILAVAAQSSAKLTKRSGLVMLSLGIVMLIRPEILG